MSNIDKRAREKLKSAASKAVDNFDPNMFVETRDMLALLDELETKDKRIYEQREIMRQAASDISYAIFNLTGSDLSRLQPGVVETTDPTDTALIAERSLRAAAAGKGEVS
ncbi:Uncharacterised protein [Enterobacter hormaechei]|uniref:hypothetical protein n=1 Tax=Enterobacter hormaechei TaxID=158836 RepID=UPI0012511C08|nr:hypothetical protein [Enterobacter hormaechei]MCM7509382.1 hypothetical protein [Enterobacter hormaechei]VAC74429.1 Uncharacterised protein [Enterobacter hormaechei]HCT8059934.1 hypothetical protein [Enterobacter hormaechei]